MRAVSTFHRQARSKMFVRLVTDSYPFLQFNSILCDATYKPFQMSSYDKIANCAYGHYRFACVLDIGLKKKECFKIRFWSKGSVASIRFAYSV